MLLSYGISGAVQRPDGLVRHFGVGSGCRLGWWSGIASLGANPRQTSAFNMEVFREILCPHCAPGRSSRLGLATGMLWRWPASKLGALAQARLRLLLTLVR